jgi:DeoR/GlpR family transcriptional regulator of sugar metabolism
MLIREERFRRITEWINRENSLSVNELSERLQVSIMTIWRDLQHLEKLGVIQRVRGGAIKTLPMIDFEPQYESKRRLHNEQKKDIAQYAARGFVKEGEIIILEGGTTVASMVKYLDQPNLTILTNALDVLVRSSNLIPRYNVMCCGGMLREKSHTMVGPQAETFFANFHANKFFLGGTGINPIDGVTDPNPLEIQVKRAMHSCAEQTILLLDSSKFGVRSLAPIIPLQEIDALVTDICAPQAMLDELAASGMQIYITEEPGQVRP